MCVLQCPCGLVVSTSRAQARCIRCGRTLGPSNRLPAPTPPAVHSKPSPTVADGSKAGATEASPDGQGPAALTTYVTLVIIAAARSLCGRGDSV